MLPGKTFRRSLAKTWVGPLKLGWWDVVIRSFGFDEGSAKKFANSSLERSRRRSASLGSVTKVSSYSRVFSNVAGILVLSLSCKGVSNTGQSNVPPLISDLLFRLELGLCARQAFVCVFRA